MKKLILLISFLFITSLCFGQNLLSNPDFENWTVNGADGPPDDWVLSSSTSFSASQEATIIHGGSYSTKLEWSTTDNRDFQQVDIPATAGSFYTFYAWVLDNDSGGKVALYIRWEDSSGDYISNSTFVYSEDNANWQQVTTGNIEAPGGTAQCEVRMRCYDVSGWSGSATIYVDDASLTLDTSTTVTNAYSISTDAVEVFYSTDQTSVDPADFELTGSATITFTTATIDGTNAKLVHLSGASTPMANDNTLDTISDEAKSTYDFYAGITSISYTNKANDPNIIDNTHFATFKGIVSANNENNKVWVSDASGAYNGVLIFSYSFDGLVDIGDEIMFTAKRSEYYNLTELTDPDLISIISTGNTPYGPDLINGSDINEDIPADTNPAEKWEGQLVKIENFYVDSFDGYNYRCKWSDGGGKTDYYFLVDDGAAPSGYTLIVGSTYQEIIGVVDYNWDHYHINPRDNSDICTIPPVNVTIQISGNDVVLTWSPGAKSTYNVYRCSDPYGTFVMINTSPVTETTYTDYGAASAETKYFYYITEE